VEKEEGRRCISGRGLGKEGGEVGKVDFFEIFQI
jgi:hypothetical protein